jgi:hypothetical protein
MVSMNCLRNVRRAMVIRCLMEGNSIRSTVHLTGVAKNTVTKLVVELGAACSAYQDTAFRNLNCKRIQADEIWSFAGAKDKNDPSEKRDKFGIGSVWTWTAIDADSKLICSWLVGARDIGSATEFIQDIAGRLAHPVQLNIDGHKPYLMTVENGFGGDIDYSILVKLYSADQVHENRYTAAVFRGCRNASITRDPNPAQISTGNVDLNRGFSKKLEHHKAALDVCFMYYNFARIQQSLRVTPAMAAGVTSKLWGVADITALLDQKQSN